MENNVSRRMMRTARKEQLAMLIEICTMEHEKVGG